MHVAPTPRTTRQIHDCTGRAIGESDGFRPDPTTGSLGLEVTLTREAAEAIGTDATRVWMPDRWVIAVRRDEIVLDRSLRELGRLLAAGHPSPTAESADEDDARKAVRA